MLKVSAVPPRRSAVLTVFGGATAINDATTAGPRRSWRCHCDLCRTSTAVAPRLRCDGGSTADARRNMLKVSAVPPRRSAVLTVFGGATAINDGTTAEPRRSWRCHCGLCRTSTALAPRLRCVGGINGNSVNQEEIRNAAAKWLEDNQLLNGDVHLPEFFTEFGFVGFIEALVQFRLRGAEWGDQLALIGIVNVFGVAIGIVSSIHVDSGIQYIYPQNNIVGQPCIFLGHEFETHYIRLVPLYETAPMPQSDQQTVEDQGGAGYDKLNSDIRDASVDDQPCWYCK